MLEDTIFPRRQQIELLAGDKHLASPPVNPPNHHSLQLAAAAGLRFPNFPTSHQSPVVGCWSLPDRCLSTATNSAAEGGVFIFIQSIPSVARVHDEQRRVVMTESHVDGCCGLSVRRRTTARLELRTTGRPLLLNKVRGSENAQLPRLHHPPLVRSVRCWRWGSRETRKEERARVSSSSVQGPGRDGTADGSASDHWCGKGRRGRRGGQKLRGAASRRVVGGGVCVWVCARTVTSGTWSGQLYGRRTRPVPLWSGGNCVQGSGSHPSRRRLCPRRLPLAGIIFLEQIEEDDFRCELIRPASSFFPALLLSLGSLPRLLCLGCPLPAASLFLLPVSPSSPSETPVRSYLLPCWPAWLLPLDAVR